MSDEFQVRPRPPFRPSDEPAKKPKKFKPKRWSHQDELTALKGTKITVCFTRLIGTSSYTQGVLLEADQFTLKIDRGPYNSPEIVFKHTIHSFRGG